jgi:hypothetical protein
LTQGKNEGAEPRFPIDHGVHRVLRLAEGGFVLDGGERYRVSAVADGWRVEAGDEIDGWRIRRSGRHGFVLQRREDEGEVARTMPLVGAGAESGLRFLLLDDGRLFRIAMRGPRDGCYELLGWETSGAYMTAHPETEGWNLRSTPAGSGLEDVRVIVLMLATVVLDAEGCMRIDGHDDE